MDPQILAKTPAGKPPPGVKPDFDNPPRDRATTIGIGSVLLILTLLFVVARIFTKVKVVGKTTPDDYTCIAATIGAVVYYVFVVLAVTVGKYGIHSWDLHLSDLTTTSSLVMGFICNWPFFLFIMFAKLSFFLLYLQIFRPMRWLRYSSYAGATFTVIFYIAMIVFNLVVSAPAPGESWQQVTKRPTYGLTISATVGIACVGLALDVTILLLPIAGVAQLQMSRKRRIGVVSVFLTGSIAVIASSLSIYYKKRLDDARHTDPTYKLMPVLTTALVELYVGIIASCMPSMSNFLRHVPDWNHLKSFLSSRSRYSSKEGSYESGATGSHSKPKRTTYKDLESWRENEQRIPGYEMGQGKAFVTAVPSERQGEFVENGIHLQHDIEQQTQERGAAP